MSRPRGLPRSDDLDDFHAIYGGVLVPGSIESQLYPDDVSMQTDEELEAWRDEIRARIAKKKPCGFAPWPKDAEPS